MNVIHLRARDIRRENAEERAKTVKVTVSEAEVQEAFEDLLVAANAMRLAQEAMNRAHDRYTRLCKGRDAS